jgi:hypothetical protein
MAATCASEAGRMLASSMRVVSPLSLPLPSPPSHPQQVGIERATGVVWNISGPPNLTLHEVRRRARPCAM